MGIYIIKENHDNYFAGDCFDTFTMQSVVKPLIHLLALMDSGIEKVRALVGVDVCAFIGVFL